MESPRGDCANARAAAALSLGSPAFANSPSLAQSAAPVVPARLAEGPQFDEPIRLSRPAPSGTIADIPWPVPGGSIMSTLGKVLLFLNLLAAGGLCYLTVQDWSKRQEINGVLLRYH